MSTLNGHPPDVHVYICNREVTKELLSSAVPLLKAIYFYYNCLLMSNTCCAPRLLPTSLMIQALSRMSGYST